MTVVNPYISIITLNINRLNSPITDTMTGQIKKQTNKQTKPNYMLPTGDSFQL